MLDVRKHYILRLIGTGCTTRQLMARAARKRTTPEDVRQMLERGIREGYIDLTPTARWIPLTVDESLSAAAQPDASGSQSPSPTDPAPTPGTPSPADT